jgi:hypothetical protein
VKFGIGYFPTDEGIDPPALARMCEERGFESLFFTDHTHIPAGRQTDYPIGGELPREYSRIHDPFVALMAAAAATERLMVGTGVCLVVERDPILTAKAAASVDRLSGGRMLFGVGAGWNAEEMRNHGTDPARRFGVMRERVEAIKEIWTSDEAEYHGRYVDFDPIWCWPSATSGCRTGSGTTTRSGDGSSGCGRRGFRRRSPTPPPTRRCCGPTRRPGFTGPCSGCARAMTLTSSGGSIAAPPRSRPTSAGDRQAGSCELYGSSSPRRSR